MKGLRAPARYYLIIILLFNACVHAHARDFLKKVSNEVETNLSKRNFEVHHHVTLTIDPNLILRLPNNSVINPDLFLDELICEYQMKNYNVWPFLKRTEEQFGHFNILLKNCRFDDDDILVFLSIDSDFVIPPGIPQIKARLIGMITMPGPATINGSILQYQTLCRWVKLFSFLLV